jgi:magnesium chelatase family protein
MATVVAPREAARSVARVSSCALWGLESAMVTVEADVANGLPHFTVVGMPDAAVSEARERVRAAIRNGVRVSAASRRGQSRAC